MGDTVLKVENVSKKFCKSMKNLMLYGSLDIMRDFIGIPSRTEVLRPAEFWAVRDVSFELSKGETLGLIGINGSGKSTLLKMINGIFFPDTGRISYSGKMSALIQVGVGFHPLLTGRENVYINGQIIGMTKKEIDERYEEIVEFSEIGDFIDSPVKHYSSGMLVRLGFSVAVHCNPDIMLIDEVLAVGDIAFRKRCAEKIEDIKSKTAVVLVSHNMNQIDRLCSKVLLLDKGVVEKYGDTGETVNYYYNNKMFSDTNSRNSKLNVTLSTGTIDDINIALKNSNGEETNEFKMNEKMEMEFNIHSIEIVERPIIGVQIISDEGVRVTDIKNVYREEDRIDKFRKGSNVFKVVLKKPPMTPGKYLIFFVIKDRMGISTLIMASGIEFTILSPSSKLTFDSIVSVEYDWINNY